MFVWMLTLFVSVAEVLVFKDVFHLQCANQHLTMGPCSVYLKVKQYYRGNEKHAI